MKALGMILTGMVLAGLMVTAGWYWRDGTVTPQPSIQAPVSQVDNTRLQKLEQQVAALSDELKKAEKAQRRPVFNFQWHGVAKDKSAADSSSDTVADAGAQTSPPPPSPEQTSSPPPSPEQASGDAQRALIGNLENQFDNESRDNTWSANASAAITSYFDNLSSNGKGQTSYLDSVDCRSSLCKVEVTNVNAEAAQEFAMTFPMTVGPELPSATYDYHPRANGQVDLTLYLSKQVN